MNPESPSASQTKPPIWVLSSFSGAGGVEKLLSTLCGGLAKNHHPVHLVLIKQRGPFVQQLDPSIRVHKLAGNSSRTALPGLVRLMREQQPQTVLVAKERSAQLLLRCRARCGWPRRIVFQVNTHVSQSFQHRPALVRWYRLRRVAGILRRVDQVVAVSTGVASDLQQIAGRSIDVRVIHNPLITEEMLTQATAPREPKLKFPGRYLLASGRLSTQKGFDTLLRAFAHIPVALVPTLVILGEGKDRAALIKLASELNIRDRLQLPGFVDNPFPWMREAAAFVLSSRWEGFGNVLAEAMALGTPVISTRCPSGPEEILEEGRLGPLVEVDDAEALAAAIRDTLAAPPPSEMLQQSAQRFALETGVRRYASLLDREDRST